MKNWIIPNNPNDYDIYNGLATYGNDIEWTKKQQTKSIETGDIVYLYEIKPTGAITMMFEVIEHIIATPTQRHRNDGTETSDSWFKIRFLKNVKPIAYETLLDSGVVRGIIRGARELSPEQARTLSSYIQTRDSSVEPTS